MTSNPHDDAGKHRARGGGRAARRRKVPRGWFKAGIGAFAIVLVAGGTTAAKPMLFDEPSASTAVARIPDEPMPVTKTTQQSLKNKLTRSSIQKQRKALLLKRERAARKARLARLRAERLAKLRAAPLPVKVAYFNMLGCYHTDRDEPNFGHLAYHMGSCQQRMPQQYSWLEDQGITIAGVGEFQGKAWRVLAGIHGGEWGIFPRGQSGPYGQNPVVWRTSEWKLLDAEELRHSLYNCANGGSCKASSSLVLLQHRKTPKRKVYVLNTHHTSDGKGGGRRAANRSMELDHIRRVEASGIPVIYMGDFNEVGGAIGHIGQHLEAAFSGMGIDQIWGSRSLDFRDGHYDHSFRRWTDHHSGIAIATAVVPNSPKNRG